MMKLNNRSLMVMAAIALVMWYLMSSNSKMRYETAEAEESAPVIVGSDVDDEGYAPASLDGTQIELGQMNAGTGLASSLLPREVASQEDFGQFAPQDILKGQNFLEPRAQIGWPETIGGNLRNANQQVRAEPPNPKEAYTWNNSTIVPDLMQRKICT